MVKIGVGGTGNIDSVQMDEQASEPSTPSAGKSAIFLKADGLYVIDDAGSVVGPLVDAAGGGGYTENARVYNDANQALAYDTLTLLSWNSEDWDTDTIHDPSTNPSRLTCKTAGKYAVAAGLGWSSNNTGRRDAWFYKNGAALNIGDQRGGQNNTYMTMITVLNLSVSDYLEVKAQHTVVGGINVSLVSWFSMWRIG